MNFHIISVFPQLIKPYFDYSILGRAQKKGHIQVHTYNLLDYCEASPEGKLPKRVDAKPYGGGPGMVIRPEPVMRAVADAVGRKRNVTYIHFAPRATKFTNEFAREIADLETRKKSPIRDVVILCGRYEGIDSRIVDMYPGYELSIGEYVLTGGELAAAVVVDAVARQIPDVLGDHDSLEDKRVDASSKYYTRPSILKHKGKKYHVPGVLISGNHAEIIKWRKSNR